MNVTLRQLRAFLVGTRCSSFSEAAEKSFLTQPGYSLVIRQLEAELGVKLFDRTTRRVEITAIGRELADRLEKVIADLDDALENTRDVVARRRGRVTIGILPSVASSIAGRLVAQLGEVAPHVVLSFKEELSEALCEAVASSEVDFAVGVDCGDNSEINFARLASDKLLGVFHPDESVLAHEPLKWAHLSELHYIAFAQSSIQQSAARAFAQEGLAMSPLLEVKFVSTAINLVREGTGFTVLPQMGLQLGKLEGVKVRQIYPEASRDIGILVPSRRSLSPAASLTAEITTDVITTSDLIRSTATVA